MCPARLSNNPADCPLGIDCMHAPNGTEFSLGCILCRDEAQKEIDDKHREEDAENADILSLLTRMNYGNVKDPFSRPRGTKLWETFVKFHRTRGEKCAHSKVLKRVDMTAFLLRCAPQEWLDEHSLGVRDLEEQKQLVGIMNVGTRRKERRRITSLYLSFLALYSAQDEKKATLSVLRGIKDDDEGGASKSSSAKIDVVNDDDGAPKPPKRAIFA